MNKVVEDVAAEIKAVYEVMEALPKQLEPQLNTIREGLEGVQRQISLIQPLTITIPQNDTAKIDPDLMQYYIEARNTSSSPLNSDDDPYLIYRP